MLQTTRFSLLCVALGLVSVSAGTANAETSPPMFMQIVPLPGYQFCEPRAISGDGLTVVGRVFTPSPPPAIAEAFLWNMKSGMIGLGILPETQGSGANAVSHDGLVVVGNSGSPDVNIAFRWTTEDGMQPLPSLAGATQTIAQAVSADGQVVAGRSGTDINLSKGFRWTALTGTVAISSLVSPAYGISDNGNVIVGGLSDAAAFRWTTTSGMQVIYNPPGLTQTARAVSANGSVIVGGSFGNAFRWTAATGGQQIPNMTFGWAVSADGSVVGATDVPGTAEVARIWTAECSTRTLRDLLLAAGLSEVAGWQLGSIYGIADDNRTIVGVGIAPGSSAVGFGLWDGFIARLPRAGDLNFDGDVNVDDLLKAINSWGPCKPDTCTFIDANCDNSVDQSDLMAVIDNWDL